MDNIQSNLDTGLTTGTADAARDDQNINSAPAEGNGTAAHVAANGNGSAAEPVVSAVAPAGAGLSSAEAPATEASVAEAPVSTPPAAETPRAPSRSSRQPSMAQVMESEEFKGYLSGVDILTRGALLKGVVVRVDEGSGEVLVDIGTKSEGVIARNELGEEDVNVGDEIEVVVLRPEDDEGHPVLSKRRADYEKTWRILQEAKDKGTYLEGTVREQVKGGLIVDLGVPAFVPASHVDARNRGDLSRFVGRTIPLRVIEIDKKKNKVIGSHRMAAEEERRQKEEQAWTTLQKDKIVEGTVRRITDFGAFIDLGGIDGLLHVREMAWGRVEHPEHVVKKGQKLQVLILDIDEDRKRIALGLKQLQSDPWKKVAKNYRIGQTVTGKILRIAPSCAFMELEEGVEGIIPISEMSDQRIKTPDEVLAVGQTTEARIKQIQANQRRITLSLKAAVQDRERRETRTAVREVNERAGGDDTVRLGDVFGQQLRAARDRGRERNEARTQMRARAMEAADIEEWDEDEPGVEPEAGAAADTEGDTAAGHASTSEGAVSEGAVEGAVAQAASSEPEASHAAPDNDTAGPAGAGGADSASSADAPAGPEAAHDSPGNAS